MDRQNLENMIINFLLEHKNLDYSKILDNMEIANKASALAELIEKGFSTEVNEASYDQGYEDGHDEGTSCGYDDGYEYGHADGYEEAKEEFGGNSGD